MRSAKSQGGNSHGNKFISTQTPDRTPTILPQKQVAKKPYRRAITPSPPKANPSVRSASRPQTSLALYNDHEGIFDTATHYLRPKSAFGNNNDRTQNVYTIARSKTPSKVKTNNKSAKSSQRSKKTPVKARVVWEDNVPQEHQDETSSEAATNSTSFASSTYHTANNSSTDPQTWTKSSQEKGRTTLPRRRTGFNAGALIPGSVSTMVSLPESNDDHNSRSIASPSFQNLLDCDTSSDYETDLEEDFPVPKKVFDPSGRNVYHKLCKEQDLVPVSYLSDRFKSKEIIMKHHGLGSEGTLPIAKALIKNTFTEKLDLTDNYIEAPGAIALARMLLDNCFITEILRESATGSKPIDAVLRFEIKSVNKNADSMGLKIKHSIPDSIQTYDHAARISNAMSFMYKDKRKMENIKLGHEVKNLSQNFLRSQGGVAFASMLLKNTSLTKLVLRSNHLTDKDAKAFADAMKENRTLTHLDLSHNEIGEMGGIYLGAGLGMNYGLKHLDLSWNCIRFKGAVGMAQGLKTNDCLSHLNISWNGLSLLGCVALGRFLKKNEALESLDISNNRIGLLATQKLALGIAAHPNLKVLKIGKNPIGDGGVETLLNVIKAHRTIKFLSLENITVSPKIFDEIKEIEKEKGVTIITGGIGGYKRPKEMPPGMRILLSFIQDNRLRLVDWFNQFDKDHSGGISREEFKTGLKETGLVMTQRQLDRLIDFIDVNNDGEIEFSELLRGREVTMLEIRQEKKIEERQRKLDEERMRLPKLEGYDYDLM